MESIIYGKFLNSPKQINQLQKKRVSQNSLEDKLFQKKKFNIMPYMRALSKPFWSGRNYKMQFDTTNIIFYKMWEKG